MNSLPKIKENEKSDNNINLDKKQKISYDYFTIKIPKNTIDTILKIEKDDRFVYFLKYGTLRRFEGEADTIFVEIPQIPKKIVVYRRPNFRQKSFDRLYLNSMDLPHIPLFEGEENLKLLSLENNIINKIDHLVSLNYLLYLNLYANKISEIENLQTVPKLRALMLGKNQIEKIKNLSSLADLEVLDLHSNKIKVVENLSSLKKLRLLNLANNQITSFNELLYNKNIEEINLRKNLIVSIPNGINLMEKLKKLNLGKNMISKIDNLVELKKIKTLMELIIENNPVLVLKEVSDVLKYLPIKIKNSSMSNSQSQKDISNVNLNSSIKHIPNTAGKESGVKTTYSTNINNINKENSSMIKREDFISPVSSPLRKTVNYFNQKNLPEIGNSSQTERTEKMNEKEIENSTPQDNIKSEEITEDQSNNIISHIEKEWQLEFQYIVDNGYNGYNTKRLKESKIVSGHAELEGNHRLNFYGNVFEVLDQEEFYKTINTLHFEFFNIDLIANKTIIDKLKKFSKLKTLIFSNNNLHSFYQLIKFEEFTELESVIINKNEICDANFLKYFLIYRFQNLKTFNNIEITQKDILEAKKVFEFFDKCISHNDVKYEEEKNGEKEDVKNFIDFDLIQRKNEFFNFVDENLLNVLEEIIDENI